MDEQFEETERHYSLVVNVNRHDRLIFFVTSSTGKGVVLIGGSVKYQSINDLPMLSQGLIELTENSTGELQWIPLKQKLKHARQSHLTFEISKDALANIIDENL